MTREEAIRILNAAGVPDAANDTRRLYEFALSHGAKNGFQDRENPDSFTTSVFKSAVDRRANRIPVSQITGIRAFWTHDNFHVTSDVLDPRPETELLVELGLKEPFRRVLDLGTGSGCILISLILGQPDATGVGTDISEKALEVAGKNGKLHGVADRLSWQVSNWFDNVDDRFDLIVSNPPYIALEEMQALQPEVRDHEPRIALTDGADGLSAYKRIAACVGNHLTKRGRVLVEIGPTQAESVTDHFRAAGLSDIRIHRDLDGRDRAIAARV